MRDVTPAPPGAPAVPATPVPPATAAPPSSSAEATNDLGKYGSIGFIGLGIMGRPMARNLMRRGGRLVVFNRSARPVAELAAEGAEIASSPMDVGRRSNVVILMLPDSLQVRDVMLGPQGVLRGAGGGAAVIDMSSVAPDTSVSIAEECRAVGVRFMDAPVSGGQTGAVAGTLSIMVGGSEALFAEYLPLLSAMGRKVVRVGDVGAGNVVKLVNQVIVAVNIAAMSEAMVLGVKAGVDPGAIFEAVRAGLAGSAILEAKVPAILERRFEPGFQVNLHAKDLRNVLETGHAIGVPLPLTALVMEMLQALKAHGKGTMDHSSLIQFYEELAGVTVGRLA